jgi:hypothetical protein
MFYNYHPRYTIKDLGLPTTPLDVISVESIVDSDFPELVDAPDFYTYDISDTEVLAVYLRNPSNFVLEVEGSEGTEFLITDTDMLSIEPIIYILDALILASIGF